MILRCTIGMLSAIHWSSKQELNPACIPPDDVTTDGPTSQSIKLVISTFEDVESVIFT